MHACIHGYTQWKEATEYQAKIENIEHENQRLAKTVQRLEAVRMHVHELHVYLHAHTRKHGHTHTCTHEYMYTCTYRL